MNRYKTGLEPVRVIGWIVSATIVVTSVAKQVQDTYDEGTGWFGLALAALSMIATEAQRRRVTPMRALTGEVSE